MNARNFGLEHIPPYTVRMIPETGKPVKLPGDYKYRNDAIERAKQEIENNGYAYARITDVNGKLVKIIAPENKEA